MSQEFCPTSTTRGNFGCVCRPASSEQGQAATSVFVALPAVQKAEGLDWREAEGIFVEVFGQRTKSGCDLRG